MRAVVNPLNVVLLRRGTVVLGQFVADTESRAGPWPAGQRHRVCYY
jgi:hypothetical protein